MKSGPEFVRTMLRFADNDDDEHVERRPEWERASDWEGESNEEEKPASRSRSRNRFISDQSTVFKKGRDKSLSVS